MHNNPLKVSPFIKLRKQIGPLPHQFLKTQENIHLQKINRENKMKLKTCCGILKMTFDIQLIVHTPNNTISYYIVNKSCTKILYFYHCRSHLYILVLALGVHHFTLWTSIQIMNTIFGINS